MQVKILFTGEHDNHDLGDGSYMIYPHTSSVTLLWNEEYKILFDTGSFVYQEQLLTELKKCGVHPDDITHICLTHFHLDHTANCVLFKNAEVHASISMTDHKTGRAYIWPNGKPELPLDIQVLKTPGHTPDHVVYFFEVDGVHYCIAGDAVREDNILEPPHYYDEKRKSEMLGWAKEILQRADVIVPGHFKVIEGEFREELLSKL
jgi:glyoxylase-like metal-dependent hydrolase (beta-lactamase superfamily II)